jgi:hypothetical protein
LNLIAEFADKLCKEVPLKATHNNVELTGNAKAELKGVLGKVADLGFEGATKYQTGKSEGLLQNDLISALKDNNACRLKVWDDLQKKLIKVQQVPQPPRRNSQANRPKAKRLVFQPDPEKAEGLASRTYTGPFKLRYGDDKLLGNDFQLTSRPAPGQPDQTFWEARFGQYDKFNGYWIYLPNINICWQVPNGKGPLVYWNRAGTGRASPEDWELFVFETVEVRKAQVKVRNIYGAYVRYKGNGFHADASLNDASVFVVE